MLRTIFYFISLFSLLVYAQDNFDKNTIAVYGQSEIHVEPDIFKTNIVIKTSSADLAKANRSNKVLSQKVLDLILDTVDKEDVSTKGINNYRSYFQDKPQHISENSIMVSFRNFDLHTQLIDQVTQYSEVEIRPIGFEYSNKQLLEENLLKNALNNARKKAQTIAQTYGLNLGQVVWVSEYENTQNYPQPMAFAANLRSSNRVSKPMIQSQKITFTKKIHAKFSFQ